MLVDSHCHLNYPELAGDLDGVIQRAQAEGIDRFLTISTKLHEWPEILKILETYPVVYGTAGIHPHEVTETLSQYSMSEVETQLREHLAHSQVIGLGETGYDFYYDHGKPEDQKALFALHIELCLEHDMPLIIHTRDAEEETIELLKPYAGKVKGIFHCFSGSAWLANQALDLGFHVSASGIITFKKAEELRAVFKTIPQDRLLVETDSPFLAPVPHRGKPCEPAYVRHTAELLAELRGESIEDLAKATTQNFQKLFGVTF